MCHYFQYCCGTCYQPVSGRFIDQPCDEKCGLGQRAYSQTRDETMFPYPLGELKGSTQVFFETLCQECAREEGEPYDPLHPDQNLLAYPENEPVVEGVCWHIPSLEVNNDVIFRDIDWTGCSPSSSGTENNYNEEMDPLDREDEEPDALRDLPSPCRRQAPTTRNEETEEVQCVMLQRSSQISDTTFSNYLDGAIEEAQIALHGLDMLEYRLNTSETSDARMQTLFDCLSSMLQPSTPTQIQTEPLCTGSLTPEAIASKTTHLSRCGKIKSFEARVSLLPAPLHKKPQVAQKRPPSTPVCTSNHVPLPQTPNTPRTSEKHRNHALALLSGDNVGEAEVPYSHRPTSYDVGLISHISWTSSSSPTSLSLRSTPSLSTQSFHSIPSRTTSQQIRIAEIKAEVDRQNVRKHLFDVLARRLKQLDEKESQEKQDRLQLQLQQQQKQQQQTLVNQFKVMLTHLQANCNAVTAQVQEHWILSSVMMWIFVVIVLSLYRLEEW